ncbi:hypothetical protein B0T20DRAFT_364658, partial [Sordaria brevicollis]
APRHDLLKLSFRVIPINKITREITQNMKVVPVNEQMEAKAREVVEQVVEIGIRKETAGLALTKLLSNFSYLYEWGKCKDKWVWVSVFLLKAMMEALKRMKEEAKEAKEAKESA